MEIALFGRTLVGKSCMEFDNTVENEYLIPNNNKNSSLRYNVTTVYEMSIVRLKTTNSILSSLLFVFRVNVLFWFFA